MHHHVVHVLAVAAVVHPHVIRALLAVHGHIARHIARVAVRAVRAATAAILSRKPKISVITPTWQRRELLLNRCVPSVRAQSYDGEIEHVIVSDGPDEALAGVPGMMFLDAHRLAPNKGIRARIAGTRLATGELIAYLDDDNAWRKDHLELLEAAISGQDVSFAYSRAACSNGNGCRWEIGCAPPVFGQVDTSLIVHRAGLLETAAWEPSGRPADWHLVDRWLAAGARWTHVPKITMDYFASTPLLAGRALTEFQRSYLAVHQQPA
jgi:glycosyltransferase involved in cell wall biosynthesis